MTPKEYSPLALRTAAGDYPAIKQRMSSFSSVDTLHAALGMSSEAGEVLEIVGFEAMADWPLETFQGVVAELGDCCWFLNLACSCGFADMSDFGGQTPEIIDMSISQMILEDGCLKLCLYSSTFCDMVKAHIFYGKELDHELVRDVLSGYYDSVLLCCAAMCITVEEVLDKNIAKLQARYGDKFSESRAITRDLVSEKEAYSK
jgi:hypothetical protein